MTELLSFFDRLSASLSNSILILTELEHILALAFSALMAIPYYLLFRLGKKRGRMEEVRKREREEREGGK
jgi:hypothetical protein